MQPAASRKAKTRNISSIRWNFRFDQSDVKHVCEKKAPQGSRRFFHREGILVWELIVRACQRLFAGFDIYAATVLVETHNAIYQRENGVIPSQAHVSPGEILRSALADDDVARNHFLAAKFLHSEPFADAIAPVFNAALTFFVRHYSKLQSKNCQTIDCILMR